MLIIVTKFRLDDGMEVYWKILFHTDNQLTKRFNKDKG